MQIKHSTISDPAAGQRAGSSASPRNQAAGQSVSGGTSADQLTLTPAARQLLEANRAAPGDGVDATRVAQIKAQIADGRYQVDAQRVAERILAMEKAL
ncbi:MAG: flagellar biosynthesis anti-sigma factor FlgM [Gammaproteobacteria bacterium]|nr:flagellar biosynthesis anti-sigma factor FlgM [Gammaproteobacteria bacterium]